MHQDLTHETKPNMPAETSTDKSKSDYFFTASTAKLVVMSIFTLGLYEIYWFYKNWVYIKTRTDTNIMPFWRAVFSYLWAYSCFRHIKTAANENEIQESLPIGFLAIIYFVLVIMSELPDPYWLISLFSFTAIIPANKIAANVNKKVVIDFRNNEKYSGWNWSGIILGVVIFALAVIGNFAPEL